MFNFRGSVHRREVLCASASAPRSKASIQVDIDSRPWRPSAIYDQNGAFLDLTSMEISDREATRPSSHRSDFYSVAYVGINCLCASTNKCLSGETGAVAN